MLRAAVVGVNHIGKIHCSVYKRHSDVQLVAVCDLLEDRAQSAAREFGVKAYTDLKRMLSEQDIDIVSIATSGTEGGGHHFGPTMIAIEAGTNVLVEKPLSNSIEEARIMVAAAREKGVRLACNLNHRFTPAAYRGKELMQSGGVGQLLFMNMKLTIRNPNDSSPWVHMRALHPHSIDVMRYFGGDIKRVQAFMTKAPGRVIWSTASINMQFHTGAVGHLTGSYDMSMKHPIEMCEVAGHEGRFVIDNVYENITFYPHESDTVHVVRNSLFSPFGQFNDTFSERIGHFVKQIMMNVPPAQVEGSGADALAAQEVIEAAILSHQQGGTVIDVPSLKY